MRERQAKFFGYVMRRDGMENNITTVKMSGRKSRGKQRVIHLDGVKMWLHKKNRINMQETERSTEK